MQLSPQQSPQQSHHKILGELVMQAPPVSPRQSPRGLTRQLSPQQSPQQSHRKILGELVMQTSSGSWVAPPLPPSSVGSREGSWVAPGVPGAQVSRGRATSCGAQPGESRCGDGGSVCAGAGAPAAPEELEQLRAEVEVLRASDAARQARLNEATKLGNKENSDFNSVVFSNKAAKQPWRSLNCKDRGHRSLSRSAPSTAALPQLLEQPEESAAGDARAARAQTNAPASANVQVSEAGDMCLQVRISPAELVQWRELQVISCIDEASFGEVLLAKRGKDVVCVKRCRNDKEDGSMTKEQLQNFEREINAYRALRHPGITSYLGCILEQLNLGVVLEHLPNGNVFDLLYMDKINVKATIRLKIARQVTDAVSFMHSSDPVIAHLDLKTPNVLLDLEFNAKLCDFGKSRVIGPRGSAIDGQELLGSPRYMAPELFGGSGARFSEKADIWGLGCCLVEIMGGPLPYEDLLEVEDILAAHTRRQPPMAPSWFAFEARIALERCFDFDPDGRLKAAELHRTLQLLTPHRMELHGMDKRRAR